MASFMNCQNTTGGLVKRTARCAKRVAAALRLATVFEHAESEVEWCTRQDVGQKSTGLSNSGQRGYTLSVVKGSEVA